MYRDYIVSWGTMQFPPLVVIYILNINDTNSLFYLNICAWRTFYKSHNMVYSYLTGLNNDLQVKLITLAIRF